MDAPTSDRRLQVCATCHHFRSFAGDAWCGQALARLPDREEFVDGYGVMQWALPKSVRRDIHDRCDEWYAYYEPPRESGK